jgi:hypothetical protein
VRGELHNLAEAEREGVVNNDKGSQIKEKWREEEWQSERKDIVQVTCFWRTRFLTNNETGT